MYTLIRRESLPLSPWKDVGGLTRELYVQRDAQGRPLWRLSMALVERSGPFSAYPGTQRVLAVVRGGPLRLLTDGKAQLLPLLTPVTFSGDAVSAGELLGEPLEDLNVMAWQGWQARLEIAKARDIQLDGLNALVSLDDGLPCQSPEGAATPLTLAYGDALIWPVGAEAGWRISGEGRVAAARLSAP